MLGWITAASGIEFFLHVSVFCKDNDFSNENHEHNRLSFFQRDFRQTKRAEPKFSVQPFRYIST
jgi:hypothetical protein